MLTGHPVGGCAAQPTASCRGGATNDVGVAETAGGTAMAVVTEGTAIHTRAATRARPRDGVGQAAVRNAGIPGVHRDIAHDGGHH